MLLYEMKAMDNHIRTGLTLMGKHPIFVNLQTNHSALSLKQSINNLHTAEGRLIQSSIKSKLRKGGGTKEIYKGKWMHSD